MSSQDPKRLNITFSDYLNYIAALRSIIIFSLILGTWLAKTRLGILIPTIPILLGIGMLVLVNLMSMLRARVEKRVMAIEVLLELIADTLALTIILYFSGGTSNPFASYYLLLLTVSAVVLPARLSWCLAALILTCYTSLIFFNQPMIHTHDAPFGLNPAFNLHTIGAWMTFAISTLIIAILVAKTVASLRERERRLAVSREENLRNERIVALGTFAAGAAHELGTPLSTIAVVANELERRLGQSAESAEAFRLLRAQVLVCKQILTELTRNAHAERIESCAICPADQFVQDVLNDWQDARPEANLHFSLPASGVTPSVIVDATIKQALVSVLNNAADVSPGNIEVNASWNETALSVEVVDQGPGFNEHDLHRAGNSTFTTKANGQGLGIGLYLARAALARFGGSLMLSNRTGGGAQAKILLPLSHQT